MIKSQLVVDATAALFNQCHIMVTMVNVIVTQLQILWKVLPKLNCMSAVPAFFGISWLLSIIRHFTTWPSAIDTACYVCSFDLNSESLSPFSEDIRWGGEAVKGGRRSTKGRWWRPLVSLHLPPLCRQCGTGRRQINRCSLRPGSPWSERWAGGGGGGEEEKLEVRGGGEPELARHPGGRGPPSPCPGRRTPGPWGWTCIAPPPGCPHGRTLHHS